MSTAFAWVDATTHEPCPTRDNPGGGTILCTVADPAHRHVASHMVTPPADAADQRRTGASLATDKQRAYLLGLIRQRDVPRALRQRAAAASLTHADCTELIPAIQACPRHEEECAMTPEGYDDSPDQGVHQFDGGGAW